MTRHSPPARCAILIIGLITRITSAAPPEKIPAPLPASNSANQLDAARAIDGGLRYLASVQHEDGCWSLSDGGSPVGVTGYALRAFLDAGCRPSEGAHGRTVSRAVDFLCASQRDDGLLFS